MCVSVCAHMLACLQICAFVCQNWSLGIYKTSDLLWLVVVFPSDRNSGMLSFILLPVIPILTVAVWMDESLNIHSSWRHVGFIAMQNLHFFIFMC